jgi:hypothetical protein
VKVVGLVRGLNKDCRDVLGESIASVESGIAFVLGALRGFEWGNRGGGD